MRMLFTRRQFRTWYGARRYNLSARLEVSPAERAAIYSHGLHKFEVFADDAYRDDLRRRADAARQRSPSMFSMGEPSEIAIANGKIVLETMRELALLVRASRVFKITVGDLVNGVSVAHRSINDITDIERVLAKSVGVIAGTVASAVAFQDQAETVIDLETEDTGTDPATWGSAWRR